MVLIVAAPGGVLGALLWRGGTNPGPTRLAGPAVARSSHALVPCWRQVVAVTVAAAAAASPGGHRRAAAHIVLEHPAQRAAVGGTHAANLRGGQVGEWGRKRL